MHLLLCSNTTRRPTGKQCLLQPYWVTYNAVTCYLFYFFTSVRTGTHLVLPEKCIGHIRDHHIKHRSHCNIYWQNPGDKNRKGLTRILNDFVTLKVTINKKTFPLIPAHLQCVKKPPWHSKQKHWSATTTQQPFHLR